MRDAQGRGEGGGRGEKTKKNLCVAFKKAYVALWKDEMIMEEKEGGEEEVGVSSLIIARWHAHHEHTTSTKNVDRMREERAEKKRLE